MAKNTRWTDGNSDGDFTAVGNWDNGVPVATDSIFFTGAASGSVTVNQDALTASNFVKVSVGEGYTGTLGSSGTPMEFSADEFIWKGSGTLYLNNGSGDVIDDLFLESSSGAVFIGDNGAANGITRIRALRGSNITLKSTLSSVADLFVGTNANVTIEGSNAVTNVYISGNGTVNSHVAITNLDMMGPGGQFTQWQDAGAVTTMVLCNGANAIYNTSATLVTAIVGAGSVLDFTKDFRVKTLTTGRVFPGGRIMPTDGLIVTNAPSQLVSVATID